MVVPGMGFESWLDRSIQVRMGLTQSVCRSSWRCGALGVAKPMTF